MLVADLMKPDGRVFLKSVFGQIGDAWPCVSFSRPSVGTFLSREFVPGRDVMIYVGTQNPELTHNPEHRGRLIAAVVIEPSQVLETRKIVSPENWARRGDRWPLSVAVLRAAITNGPPFPKAHDVAPDTYRGFAGFENRGGAFEAFGEERDAVMALSVTALELHLSPAVQAYIGLRASVTDTPKSISQEASRMAALIIERVKRGGQERTITNPIRNAPNFSDLYALLTRKWQAEQRGLCALCGGPLVAGTKNKMMQPSADRIDSQNGSYDERNMQVTHLACNLAKNKYGLEQFEEWVFAVRETSTYQN